MQIYKKTDIGLRRTSNQDFCDGGLFADGTGWLIVCDGMGGANGGNIASAVAVENIRDGFLAGWKNGGSGPAVRDALISAIQQANAAVYETAQRDRTLYGMGTTVVAAVVAGGVAHVAHAGDSRAYMISQEGIRQITVDHSMVQELVNAGDLTEQEAMRHPRRNIITRALGVQPGLEIDYAEHEFPAGALLLLCSDGLTNYADTQEIYRLSRTVPAESLAAELVRLAREGGGGDNITAAVVENQPAGL